MYIMLSKNNLLTNFLEIYFYLIMRKYHEALSLMEEIKHTRIIIRKAMS